MMQFFSKGSLRKACTKSSVFIIIVSLLFMSILSPLPTKALEAEAPEIFATEIPEDITAEIPNMQVSSNIMAVAGLNSLQCGNMTSTKGFALKSIPEPPSDDYYISYNYKYASGQTMNGYYVWASFDGKEYDDIRIVQEGNSLKVLSLTGAYMDTDIIVAPDTWYNIVIHCKADNTAEFFVDGRRARIGSAYSVPQSGTGRMKAIGYIGDLSTATHNGFGYFDNFKVLSGNTIIAQDNFDNGSTGWLFYTTAFLANPAVNCELPVLESLTLTADRTGLLIGNSAALSLTGKFNNGVLLIPGTAESLTYTSSNESIIKVNKDIKGASIIAVGEGNATVTATASVAGIEKSATLDFIVTETPVLYSIKLSTERTSLMRGESSRLIPLGLSTDGSTTELSVTEYVYFESSNTSVLHTGYENGIPYAIALEIGTASVTASTYINNIPRQSSLDFDVIELNSISLSTDKTTLFSGNSSKLTIIGKLSDGSAADLSKVESITCQSSDTSVADVLVNGNEVIITAVAPGEADILVSATLHGTTRNASIKFSVVPVTSSKTRSTYYTDEEVISARLNVFKYDWAKNIHDSTVTKADTYLQLGHDFLWNLVTPQSIPRSYAVNQPLGCLNCGTEIDKYGNYPYKFDPANDPWKLQCPNCGLKFPTNDFNAYYESGKDKHGIFTHELADKSLLVNTLYPERGEKWGVDDGFGYRDPNNNNYTFIAYYNHWSLWYSGLMSNALNSFRDAYLYTGDMKYARAGIIILDRIADVYPAMDLMPYKVADGFWNSNGHSNRGKVVGSIWETGLVKYYLTAYDAFFPAIDDPEVIAFLSSKSDQYDLGVLKKSATGIKRNIEDGIVRQVYPAVKASAIRGNNGMHQSALAMAAVVLDTLPETKEWLDFNFQAGTTTATQVTGGNILATLVNDIDRDGHGNEAAPGYNRLWLSQYVEVANILNGYDRYPAADLYDNVKFRKMFYAMPPLMLTDLFSANIGDTGSTGNPLAVVDKAQTIRAFEQYGDSLLGQLIYFLNGSKLEGIHGDIFSADPEKIAQDIRNIIQTYGELSIDSTNLTGYGFTALKDGDVSRSSYGMVYDFSKLEVLENTALYTVFDSNGVLQLEAAKPGDSIMFKFNVAVEDDYEIDLKPFKAGTYGEYDITLDGQLVANLDFFGGTSNYEVLDARYLSAGDHTISFVCTGKNNESSGYKLGVLQLLLLNSEAQEQMESNSDTQRALWLYYGRNIGHGHPDTLNLGMTAFKLDLSPDLGYPEFADSSAHRTEWVSNTISHNTVIVNKSKQAAQVVSQPRHFDDSEIVKLIDVEAPKPYSSTSQYRRTTAMIKVDSENSYAVDFFRVTGGNDHHFSFHGAEGVVTTEGLNLVPQLDASGQYIGTYAGPNVQFGIRPANDSVAGGGYTGAGFHWLKNVDKDENPSDLFSIDWKVKDSWNIYGMGAGAHTDVHLRLTMLGQLDDLALTDGVPPRNKPGNPASLKYVMAHRSGQNLDSLFTSVIEPYKGDRYIESIVPVQLTADGIVVDNNTAKALKVTFKDGRVDYVVNSLDTSITYTVDEKFQFKGFLGVYSQRDGKLISSYVNDGQTVGNEILDVDARLTGVVTAFTKDMSISNEITVRLDNPAVNASDLLGRFIYIQNDGIRNASYRINSIKSQNGDIAILDIGDVTLIRQWKDIYDFSKGFVYDITEGATFIIPLSTELIVPLAQVSLAADKELLTRGQSASLSVSGLLESDAPAALKDAKIQYVSSNPDVAAVNKGIVTAYNTGNADIYVIVTLNGQSVQSNIITIHVTTSIETIRELINIYELSGSLEMPFTVQLKNSLDQAEHQLSIGSLIEAANHLQNLLKHLNNVALQEHVEQSVKDIFNEDVAALIGIISE